jgi:membrane protein DedA with SNARE-associated domain
MISTLAQLIAQYGYLAIGAGCLFEGEAAILLGVFAADQSLLALYGVVLSAILGTLCGDNFCFHAGRRMGRPALNARPGWRNKTARVERLLTRYGAPVMIGFRFFYGIRYVTPFVLGSMGISPLRFLLLEGLGTILWANTITLIGVYLAHALREVLANIQNAELVLPAALGMIVIIAGGIHYLRRRRRRAREKSTDDSTND